VLAIIEADADLDKVCIDGTALHAAANCGHEACVRMLIKEGAIVDLTSWEGDSPFFCACSNYYDAIITALLDANADPLIVDDDGYTAAHYGHALLPWITGKRRSQTEEGVTRAAASAGPLVARGPRRFPQAAP
jgi:ankyrin repeat protein